MSTRIRAATSTRVIALVLALGATACWGTRDSYHCDTDSDCNLGPAGRCELDQRCTVYDAACPSERRYTDHSEALSGRCFADNAIPLNACAAGQAPALPEDCFEDVCAAEPACCTTTWSEACVLEAQLRCPEVTCETHVALTATKGGITELWQLAWGKSGWTSSAAPGAEAFLVWLAPAPGTPAPRLATVRDAGRTLLVGETTYGLVDRPYQWATSVDFDRDGRDTVALSSGDATNAFTIEMIELASDARRELPTLGIQRLTFADYDHDAFPDAFAFSGNNYHVLSSIGEPGAPRELAPTSTNAIPGSATNNTPGTNGVHGLELADVDRDHQLDLIATGNTVRIHLAMPRIRDQPNLSIDCTPPVSPPGACDPTLAAFASTVVPTTNGAAMYIGLFPQRTLWRGELAGSPPGISFAQILVPCPGAPGSCPGFIGMFARDLDGDQRIDIVAIDADLALVTLLSSRNNEPFYTKPIATTTTGFTAVRASATGFTP